MDDAEKVYEFTLRTAVFKKLIFKTLSKQWAGGKLKHIQEYLPASGTVLDLGCGKGAVSYALLQRGYAVTAVDVKDLSYTHTICPVLYDGKRLPFADKSFDYGLLLTVLHHAPDPEMLLAEASRVCRNLIIIEDVYANTLQKRITFFLDSLFNLEFFGHPHTNKTDDEWRESFCKLKLQLEASKSRQVLGVCTQRAYKLKTLEK